MTFENTQFIATTWQQNNTELKQIRSTVFIKEQHVPAELEWDEFDEQSIHFLASNNNQAIACARLKPDGQIGRMAVLSNYRNQGIGTKLLSIVISHAKNSGYNMVYLHAQKQAINFYRKFEFIENGMEFIDAGILHHAMYRTLIEQ
ncbi:MAG: GNAT family N-acetyltransferase [Gammaproteobacteria bacterium]|nr:GNAT family N-acetyltransferase [Gammaproteobacteria bacterium]